MLNNRQWAVLGGMGLGAGLMFLLDPQSGRRRRSLMADKANAWSRDTACAIGKQSRNAKNHARGLVAEVRGAVRREVVDDDVLVERVRSAMGRAVSHPSAIEVSVTDGHVCLTGKVLAAEVPGLLTAVHRVRGVHAVEDCLEVSDVPGDEPSLQPGDGGSREGLPA